MSLLDLHGLKNKLEALESKIQHQMEGVKGRNEKLEAIEKIYAEQYFPKQTKVNFNIAGTVFTISTHSIEQFPDSLFYSLINDPLIKLNESIFLDRNPIVFSLLLNYVRGKKINYSRLSKQMIHDLKIEAEFFEVWEIYDSIELKYQDPKIINVTTSGNYVYKENVAGTNKFEDLNSNNNLTGVCANSPGCIIVELNKECNIEALDYMGFAGDKKIWNPSNGAGAKIFASVDGKSYSNFGVLSGLGEKLKTLTLKEPVTAKYIKFEHSTYLGLGYLKIKESVLN